MSSQHQTYEQAVSAANKARLASVSVADATLSAAITAAKSKGYKNDGSDSSAANATYLAAVAAAQSAWQTSCNQAEATFQAAVASARQTLMASGAGDAFTP